MSTDTSQRPATTVRNAPDSSSGAASERLSGPLLVAAVASVGAGLLHYLAAATHLPDETLAAVLFTVVGAVQIVWPALLRPAGRRMLLAGIVLNAVAVIVWLLSRTVGVPIGHHAGAAEAIGVLDNLCIATELVVAVAAVITLLRHRAGGRSGEAVE